MSRKPQPPTIGSPVTRQQTPAESSSGAPPPQLVQAFQYFQAGNLHRAEQSCRAVLAGNPFHIEGLHLLGVIAFQRGDAEEAVKLLKRAVDGGSDNAAHISNYARALAATGRSGEAVSMYDRALALNPDNGGAWNDRANALIKLDRLSDAEQSYGNAIKHAPRDAKAYVNLSKLLLAQGRNDEALEACRNAVSCAPKLAAVHNGLGGALVAVGDSDGAIAAYKKALEIEPGFGEAQGNLASLYEELNKIEEARVTAEQALALDSENLHALLVLAKCERRDGNSDHAVARLEKIDRKAVPAALHRDVAFELSRLYDRLERPAEAFVAMSEGNAQALAAEGVDETMGDRFLDTIERLRNWMTPDTAEELLNFPAVDDGRPDPIFLVGFPRSGTTLLGQVLDSHSGLVMVEERPMLDHVVAHVRSGQSGYPDGILGLDSAAVAELRNRYFGAVDDEVSYEPHQRIVDKFPVHLIHAGLIRAVFPRAQFILALRHPCDVVLSCFMQNFRPNPAMANFFSIERGAKTYDRAMGLWAQYEAHLKPAAHVIRYENVVTDFDAEIGALLTFLGLGWEDGVRDFVDRARSRGKIHTPSYAQVTENLYTRARYRWRRYEEQMLPAMDDLTPWIEYFGYDSA